MSDLYKKAKWLLEISPDFQDLVKNCETEDSFIKLIRNKISEYGQDITDAIIHICPGYPDFDMKAVNLDIEALKSIRFSGNVSYCPYSSHLLVYSQNVNRFTYDYCALDLYYLQKFFEYHEL